MSRDPLSPAKKTLWVVKLTSQSRASLSKDDFKWCLAQCAIHHFPIVKTNNSTLAIVSQLDRFKGNTSFAHIATQIFL